MQQSILQVFLFSILCNFFLQTIYCFCFTLQLRVDKYFFLGPTKFYPSSTGASPIMGFDERSDVQIPLGVRVGVCCKTILL